MSKRERYIPALGFKWLTPVYDPLLRWVMREEIFKRELIRRSDIQPGMCVLDLGCGTGVLTIMIKKAHPEAQVYGLDGDSSVLSIARTKSASAGVEIKTVQGIAFQLPFPDASFDRVVSSLVMHHLSRDGKQAAFNECSRVLRPGGELHIIDFGKPRGIYGKFASLIIRRMERAADNVAGLLEIMMRRSGFVGVEEPTSYQSVFGSLSALKGLKPYN